MEKENKYMRSLVENAQYGKIVALEELYEINLDRVHTLVTRLAGNELIAESITKNILVRVWEKIKEDGPGEKMFSHWIREFSVELTVKELKNPTFLNDKEIKKLLKKGNHTADFSSNPTEKLIAELDLEHRITFVLSKIENYNLSEISKFIGISESEVETFLSESIEKISQGMSEASTALDLSEHWQNLQTVIDPDNNILKSALEEIKEIRTAEIKEEEVEIEAERKEEIEEIEKAIKKDSKEKAKVKKEDKEWKGPRPPINFNKKIVLGLAIPVIIFFSIQLVLSSTDWAVTVESGTPLINNESLLSAADLSEGDVISTNELSSAIIQIPQVGRISILGSTKFKRLKETHSGELLKGKASIVAGSHKEILNIKIPKVTIENYKQIATYFVEVDQRGNSIIDLKNGWLRIYSDDDEIMIAPNYKLNIYKGSGASIPYHSQSSFEYIAFLDEYLFGGKRDGTLNQLLILSSNNEIVTLWNLLTGVNAGHQTENVYFRLYELAPHSSAINKTDILLRDPDILHKWLEEIKQQL